MKALRTIYHFLGSIYFALILIASVAFFVIAGTVIESLTKSHRYASYYTYSNPVFMTLLWGFFVNILFSALRRWPFRVSHIPFLLTHLGLLMLLGGVFIKSYFGLQGTLSLIEGSGTHQVIMPYTYAINLEKKDADHPRKMLSANFPIERDWNGFIPEIHTSGDFSSIKMELTEFIPNVKMRYSSQFKDGQSYEIDGKAFTVSDASLIMYDGGFGGYAIRSTLSSGADAIAIETPLNMTFEKMALSTHLEENSPKITLKISDGERSEKISLPYDRVGEGLRWPVLNGKYLLRFQPVVKSIAHHLRLRNARQVNYANSTQPYSYEADLIVDGNQEKIISMNNVHETWDGYRFYLANISSGAEVSAKKIQIAVNYDPAKYLLTYPGAVILCIGVVSLFWPRQGSTRVKKQDGQA